MNADDGDTDDADGAGASAEVTSGPEKYGGFDPVAFLERAVPVVSNENVSGMREFLVATLAEFGVEATVDSAGNVVAVRGSDRAGATHLVLNTHIDTVSPHVPYERDAGTIRGRGSCDAKGPLSALLAAFLGVDPDGKLTLAVTPDEETLSTGAAALVAGNRGWEGHSPVAEADMYVVGEPTGLDVCTAAKGRFEGTVTLLGASAHAAEPDSGVNAISAAAAALSALETYDQGRDSHPSLGRATLSPTRIEGGVASNQIPADCRITVDRRSVPPETADRFADGLRAHVRAAVPEAVDAEFDLVDRESPFLEAFDTPVDHRLVRTLARAVERRDGGDRGIRPFTAATEASYFAPAPVVVFGPGVLADDEGAVAHSDREYVPVDEVRVAAAALSDAVGELV